MKQNVIILLYVFLCYFLKRHTAEFSKLAWSLFGFSSCCQLVQFFTVVVLLISGTFTAKYLIVLSENSIVRSELKYSSNIYVCSFSDFVQYCFVERKLLFLERQHLIIILFIGVHNTVYWRETFCRSCCRKLNIFFTEKKSVIGNIKATQLILCQLLKVLRHVSLNDDENA